MRLRSSTRPYRWLIVGALLLSVLAAAALAVGRHAVRRHLTPERLSQLVSSHLDARLATEAVNLRLWPWPHLQIGRSQAEFSDGSTLGWRRADVYPALGSLFRGAIRLGRLTLTDPTADLKIPERVIPGPEGPNTSPATGPAALQDRLRGWVARGAGLAPGARLQIHNGELQLHQGRRTLLDLDRLEVDLRLPPGTLHLKLRAASDAWGQLSVTARTPPDLTDFKADVTLREARLERLQLWPDWLPAWGSPSGAVDLRLKLAGDAGTAWAGRIAMASAEVGWSQGDRNAHLRQLDLEADLEVDAAGFQVNLQRLDVAAPAARLTGALRLVHRPQDIRLELQGRALDVAACRALVLGLAPSEGPAADIFNVLRGGTASRIAFQTSGRSFPELGQLAQMTIDGRLVDGRLFIPGPELDLEAVEGEALIAGGILTGRRLAARVGATTGGDGALEIDFGGPDLPFRLDIDVDADLAQLPPVLARVVSDAGFREELSRIQEVAGRAQGRLSLDSRQSPMKVEVDAAHLRLDGRYDRLPFPLQLLKGGLRYDGESITAAGLSGRMGATTFEDLGGRIHLSTGFPWSATVDRAVLDAPAWHTWLSSWPGLRAPLGRFQLAQGRIALDSLAVDGALLNPAGWQFAAQGTLDAIQLQIPELVAPLRLESAHFRAAQGLWALEKAQVRYLDAQLAGEGSLESPQWRAGAWQARVRGMVGVEAHRRLETLLGLADLWRLRAPLDFDTTEVSWNLEHGYRLAGALQAPPARLEFDLRYRDRRLQEAAFDLRAQDSAGTLQAGRDGAAWQVQFRGRVDAVELKGLLLEHPFDRSRLEGELQARLHPTQPSGTSISGRLRMENVPFTPPGATPLLIEELDLAATGDRLSLSPARLLWKDRHHRLEGDIAITPGGYVLDLRHSADALVWGEPPSQPRPPGEAPGGLDYWSVPLRGRVQTRLEELRLGDWRWQSVEATVDLTPGAVHIDVLQADLCGLATPAQVLLQPGTFQLALQPQGQGRPFAATLGCLLDKADLMSGDFDFQGDLSAAAGPPGALLSRMGGNVALTAGTGRIYRFNLLGKILAVVNVTEVFRGRMPDLVGEGFAYDAIRIQGRVSEGQLLLEEAVISGASMGLVAIGSVDLIRRQVDLNVLVAPLKTVDSIVSRIPVVGEVLGGSLVSIPVAVTGPIEDPSVVPLAPSAVGSGVLRVMRRAFNLPIRLVQPLFGD